MIDEILPDLYRIEIPLPGSPLKSLNSYLIKADGRFLIIDTGMNREECKREMLSNLEKLEVDLKKTDFFITHAHADHLGLVVHLATDTSRIYMSEKEVVVHNSEGEDHWQKVILFYLLNGYPEDELKEAVENHPQRRYGFNHEMNYSVVNDGDTIEIGDYSFKCIDTRGHAPGHMSLYETNKKIFIAGDHILFDITPNIAYRLELENPLKEYLANLEKVDRLDITLLLTGHRSILNDHRKRIRELREHHQERVKEVLHALEDGEKTAFQVAPYIDWDVSFGSWELFPAAQKWFAFGETLAHLHYLEGNEMIHKRTKGQRIVFSLR